MTDHDLGGPIHRVITVEQRERERARVWLPVRLRSEGGEAFAVTYDASAKGVLMLGRVALPVGARVTLIFEVPAGQSLLPKERAASGRVVRAGPNHEDPEGLWPYRVAVQLDEAAEDLAAELAALARAHPLALGTRASR